MKIRADFVTNSSSANYSVSFALESDDGAQAKFGVRASGGEFSYDGSELHQGLLEHIEVESVSFEGMPFRHMPDDRGLDHVIRSLIGSLELGLIETDHRYDPYLTHGPRFLIVGEPQLYESREALEEAIACVGEVVAWPPDADFVICCSKPKDHDAPSDWRAIEIAVRDIRESVLAAGIKLADPDIEYLGDGDDWRVNIHEMRQRDSSDVAWRLMTDLEGVDSWEPLVISESEFSFFDPDGPAGSGTLSLMPGAIAAFRTACAEHGVTRENLRLIQVHGKVMAFGDSEWHVDDREDDWLIDVREGTAGERHDVTRRAGE